ncbi:CD3324 family protein [Bacillus horti]|uniref:Mor family transcriptional regulator n=1 Tax=Caldalkalibacillus horti TaxID=77523 RepID=A0ABT9VY84_9BACI|nr:CD3324 family protein [Bacillus horti]MDQ0165958.1 Mor family transcriptional regulator [Bacillus horti]
MSYVKESRILPKKLLTEIQKYVQGETIYIPKPETSRQKWGVRSGTRQWIDERNALLRNAFKNGASIDQLAEQHHLSTETIKKIVYSKSFK